jgi:hypothetical protein
MASLRYAVLTALVASVSLVCSAGAHAAPAELTVRVEGATRTLFEGPILTDGHHIRASSDTEARLCDGTNGGANPQPGPTPTAATADAMDLTGQSFDGLWSAGFDDYFITRWGPDAEDLDNAAFWGVLVNGVLTPVGGCQWADQAGDEVLWAYDAFSGRSLLRLATADDPSQAPGAPDPVTRVEVGTPLELAVASYIGEEGEDPDVEPAEGVTVAPVQTEAGTGFETVEVADPDAVVTAADGSASVVFAEPGWHRLKAQEEDGHIRSNRLDVCVEPIGGGDCGPLPADAQVRVPERYRSPTGTPGVPSPPPIGPPAPTGAPRLGGVRVDPRTGTASIEVVVPGSGRVALAGARVRSRSAATATAATIRLKVVPDAGGRGALRRLGKLRVAVGVEFTPSAGTATGLRRALTLRLRSP